MRRRLTAITVLLITGIIFSGCASQQELAFKSVEGKTHSAVTPVQQTAKWAASWWEPRHEAVNKRLKEGNVDLLWIGDSITHGWENQGKKIWDIYYAPRNAVNMGFGGDRTEHVLWRLDHSNFEKISPKLAIVMIGTNNSSGDDNTAGEIADGIITICKRLRTQFPKMKILLLAIFPRNPEPGAQREKNAEASLLASSIADGKTIHYMDINQKFLTDDGTLTKEIMPDFLHPNEVGYKIWAEAIESKVAELMDE
ncbi:MAG: hypothetical protein JW715_00655 [Sedimentisphaerales bacterium]|nr:hypothetical protein [Sedimentisphaerales bacterium]